MNYKYFLTCLPFVLMSSLFGHAQHHNQEKKAEPPLTFVPVLSQLLSDPELAEFKLESSVMTIVPGGVDTVSHRHDCELFGYVMDGTVEIALDHKAPVAYKSGEMFYERRNIMHTLTRNASQKTPAKVLLIFIIKNGREGYTPAYK
jgi:quercetin dioxygenase-like cupin family protein